MTHRSSSPPPPDALPPDALPPGAPTPANDPPPQADALVEASFEPGQGELSLRSRALQGSAWTIVGLTFQNVLRMASNVILAWLLFPEAFGLMGVVSVLLGILQMFSDIGIGPSIIQSRRGGDQDFLDTAWTLQVIRGAALWIVTWLIAVGLWLWGPVLHLPVHGAYADPQLMLMIPVVGVSALISGFNSTKLATSSRQIALGRPMVLEIGSQVIVLFVTVVWAAYFESVWALAIGTVVRTWISMLGSHWVLPGQPNRFRWNPSALHELIRFGRWIFVSTLLTGCAMQFDRVLLGGLIESDRLGVYFLAFNLATMPWTIGQRLTAHVLFPALSEHARRDPSALRQKLGKARSVFLPICLLAVGAMMLGSPLFFRYLYQAQYAEAAWIAPALGAMVWFSLLRASSDRALLAVGDSRALAILNGTRVVVGAAASVVGFHLWDLGGFIAGMTVGALVSHLLAQVLLARHHLVIIGQDVRYTLLLVGMVVVGLGVPQWAANRLPGAPPDMVALIVAVGVCLAVAAWAGRHIRMKLR